MLKKLQGGQCGQSRKTEGKRGATLYISFHHLLLSHPSAMGPDGPLRGKKGWSSPQGSGPRTHCRMLHRCVESDGCKWVCRRGRRSAGGPSTVLQGRAPWPSPFTGPVELRGREHEGSWHPAAGQNPESHSHSHSYSLSQRADGEPDAASFQPNCTRGWAGAAISLPWTSVSPFVKWLFWGSLSHNIWALLWALFFALFNVPLSTTVPLHKMLFPLHKCSSSPLLCWLFSPGPLEHCFNFISSENPDSFLRLRHAPFSEQWCALYLSLFSLHCCDYWILSPPLTVSTIQARALIVLFTLGPQNLDGAQDRAGTQ